MSVVRQDQSTAMYQRQLRESDPRLHTLADAIRYADSLTPGAGPEQALIFLDGQGGDQRLCYTELRRAALRSAAGLRARGVKRGDRLLLMLPTSPEYASTLSGALLLGAIPCTIPVPTTRAKMADELPYLGAIDRKLEPGALVTTAKLARDLPTSPTFDGCHLVTVEELASADSLDPDLLPTRSPDDPHHIQLTSGSTSSPKGVLLSQRNVLANVQATTGCIDFAPQHETIVSWLPLYHDMGLVQLLGSIYYQSTLAIMSPMSFLRNPLSWLRTISSYRSVISAAPTFAYSLCARKFDAGKLEGVDLSSWRRAFVGAEPVPLGILHEFMECYRPFGLSDHTLYPCYGMAETVLAATLPVDTERSKNWLFGFVTNDRIDAQTVRQTGRAQPANRTAQEVLDVVGMGRAVPGLELSIQNDRGEHLAEREIGEICVRGAALMSGYFQDQDATTAAIRYGWYHTGDRGYTVDGELYVLGRIKEIIIVRGRNYDPQAIETVIEEHAGVRKGYTIAFGVYNTEIATDEVLAVIETRLSKAEQQVLREHIQQSLQRTFGFLAREVIFVSHGTTPRTTSGKRQRLLCRTWYQAGKLYQG